MNCSHLSLAILLFLLELCLQIDGSIKFSSLECQVFTPDVGDIKECRIGSTKKDINIIFDCKKTISAFQIKFKLLKRENGTWRPFLYAMTIDICDFFQNPKKYMIPNMLYSYIKKSSNINHTCPYEAGTELALTKWNLDESNILSKMSVNSGEYAMHSSWYSSEQMVLQINGSVKYTA
ncbi:uncharacterized protein LOC115630772 [Scaptodrosophila lebanonensis]|uniref:Uncharacterized protein LOC115630772 n=1 Tax=Drosophila lebanonensis TaxID=7225 RepID=A0A6J2U3S6_DROLE|nr:uncharacterized protein LOC115630772 [Scaptodrosophila lebanonensis]